MEPLREWTAPPALEFTPVGQFTHRCNPCTHAPAEQSNREGGPVGWGSGPRARHGGVLRRSSMWMVRRRVG